MFLLLDKVPGELVVQGVVVLLQPHLRRRQRRHGLGGGDHPVRPARRALHLLRPPPSLSRQGLGSALCGAIQLPDRDRIIVVMRAMLLMMIIPMALHGRLAALLPVRHANNLPLGVPWRRDRHDHVLDLRGGAR